jgi:hypothetical protein
MITTCVIIFTQIFTANGFVQKPSQLMSKQLLSARRGRTELFAKTGDQEKPSVMTIPSDDFDENKEQPIDALIPVAVNLGETNREEKFNTIQAEINAKVAAPFYHPNPLAISELKRMEELYSLTPVEHSLIARHTLVSQTYRLKGPRHGQNYMLSYDSVSNHKQYVSITIVYS